ncbi:hypothetical protein B0H14DRAFT_2355510 [Mycena olivaceomarginata]|nr:hypothetical protein B0H14DRAFT_2355510 [Mycena olivaceomarginata]
MKQFSKIFLFYTHSLIAHTSHVALVNFYNLNGETSARLDASNSVYAPIPDASYRFIFISPFLFNCPHTHLANIHKMYKDELLHCKSWIEFVRCLRSEWQDTILFGTLILNANVGFLAISSVTEVLELPAQTLSYISVFFGLGSIMTGAIQYPEDRDGLFANDAVRTISTYVLSADRDSLQTRFFKMRSVIGFESLAMLYSLPYAFMIWGYAVHHIFSMHVLRFFAGWSHSCLHFLP